MEKFGLFVYSILLGILFAFVMTKLWGWFVVPFFEVKPLTLVYAMGFYIIVAMLRGHKYRHENIEPEELLGQAVLSTILPFIALFFGWIIHLFI